MYDLEGKVAIVTGAGRKQGIGRAISLALAAEGADVVVSDIKSAPDSIAAKDGEAGWQGLPSLVEEIEAMGRRGLAVECDVSDTEQVASMVTEVMHRFGHIDILVNNAGITRDRLLMRMDPADWDQVLKVNLRGAFVCTRQIIPHMIKQRRGRIVNMSSVVGLSGNPGQANYAAAKAGLVGFTKAVAREVASRNINVNAIAPGFITTGMVEVLSEETRKQILGRIPLGRFGTVEDIAQAALFLCSDRSGYITGQVLTVDGGMIA